MSIDAHDGLAIGSARTRRLAWGLAALAVGLQLGGLLVEFIGGALTLRISPIFTTAIAVAFATVGALVASRQPRNAIGWVFLGIALSTGVGELVRGVVEYRLQRGGDPGPLIGAVAAYGDTSWVPFILVPATFLLLLFPDGRLLPSRRWRFVARCAGAGIAISLFTGITVPTLSDYPTVDNPLTIDSPLMDPLAGLGWLLVLIGIVGSVSSVAARFRRGTFLQRQQIKWLIAAGALVAVTLPVMLVLYDVVPPGVANCMIMLSVLGLPVAAGMAILRHGLYEIDVVINRALVYGGLTATLAGSYLGSILLLQLVLGGVTADNGLAIAGSTLAVAALFRPLRTRIQATVDRRFYRRKYDAARTLERFGARLRDEVDLDALGDELRAVIGETMQPAHVSLWLRETR